MIIKYHIYPTFTPREILTCVGDILSVGSSGSLSWQDALFFFLYVYTPEYIYYSPLSNSFFSAPSFFSFSLLIISSSSYVPASYQGDGGVQQAERAGKKSAGIDRREARGEQLPWGGWLFFFSRVRENIQRLSIRTPCRSVTDLACSRSIEAALLPCIHAGMRSVLILFCIH